MTIKVLTCIDGLESYISFYNEETCGELWEKTVVEPLWDKLCCYSPINLDERKPKCVRDIDLLKKQLTLFKKLDIKGLEKRFTEVADMLPNYDDDPITVALFPIDDASVDENQDGVIGTALYGNIMIQLNPVINGFEEWLVYVFAHEYHHTVWGNYWLNMHFSELAGDLLQNLIVDGEADSFAMSICEGLNPKWLYLSSNDMIDELYKGKYLPILRSREFDYPSMMFGDESLGIVWCGGYAVGYRLVKNYLESHPCGFSELIEINTSEILE